MADALAGFRSLREMEYSIDWFAKYGPELRKALLNLAFGLSGYHDEVVSRFDVALEHVNELATALRELRSIAKEK